MRLRLSAIGAAAMLVVLAGCGAGGGSRGSALFRYRAGQIWSYAVAGAVTLPAGLGGGTQTLRADSAYRIVMLKTFANDPAGVQCFIMDRVYDLRLLDGRQMQAVQRLYVTQNADGIYIHGINNTVGPAALSANDIWSAAGAAPPGSFMYLPDPALEGATVSYANPLGLVAAGDWGYRIALGAGETPVTVPAGDFVALTATIVERFSGVVLNNAMLTPAVGIVRADLDTFWPNSVRVTAQISLTGIVRPL